MKSYFLLSILAFRALALYVPSTQDVDIYDDHIPYGAFPSSSSSSASMAPVATPSPLADHGSHAGRAIVVNACKFPVYIWSVGSTVRAETTIASGARFTETFRHDVKSGGIALKIATVQGGLYNSSPQTIFAYNIKEGQVWYDLSDVFGDPFKGHQVSLLPSSPEISWRDGIPPKGSEVRVQPSTRDLTLTLC